MFFINHTDIGEGSSAIIEIEGPLNSESAPDFDDYINKLIDNNVLHLLIDMKNLSFISSEGIGATLMIQKSINEKNGLAVFFNVNNEIASLFKLLGFDTVFMIVADRSDALHILDKNMELSPGEAPSHVKEKINNKESFQQYEESAVSEFEEPEPELFSVIEENDNALEPFVIECVKCKSLIRVKESGDQLCPYCSTEFTVSDEKKAVFKLKNIHS